MSYEQQFYLKKNEEIISAFSYEGDKIFWQSGQRDLERVFAKYGTRVSESEINFTPIQVIRLLKALNEDLILISEAYAIFDEGFYNIEENEKDYKAERILLETYGLSKIIWKKFGDKRFDTIFYMNINATNPMEVLNDYAKGIGRIVNDMNENDILVMRAG